MDKNQIETFFQVMAENLPCEITVALTGAAAGSLMGRVRPSLDIDFGILPRENALTPQTWQLLEASIDKATQKTGIAAQYARDIDRWSMISFLDYADHLRFFKKIGNIRVCFLAPEYWSIGKMGRFLDLDLQDILTVMTQEKTDPQRLAGIWGKALKASIPSTASSDFKKRVEYFFRTHGTQIWGKSFNTDKTLESFHSGAGIKK